MALQTNDPTIGNSPSTGYKEIWPHILRTCNAVYIEALPVLYGHNTFLRHYTPEFLAFATWNRGVFKLNYLFGFSSTDKSQSTGRLMLMKNLHVKLTGPTLEINERIYIHEEDPFEPFYGALNYPGNNMQKWALQPHSKLKVDFGHLQSFPEADFDIEGEFAQLMSSLKTLEVVGLSHKGALQMMKKTMEQHGGSFIVL